MNAHSALTATALALHPGFQIPDIDSELRGLLSLLGVTARNTTHDAGRDIAGLEHTNLKHAAAMNHALSRVVQGVTEDLLKLAGRIA